MMPVSAPAVVIADEIERHRISCPYCHIGYAIITVRVNKAQMTKQFDGVLDPHKCVSCGRYFKLRPTVQIVGVPMEGR